MTKRKDVTISITAEEFDSISNAFIDYTQKFNDAYDKGDNDLVYRLHIQIENYKSFNEKYWQAIQDLALSNVIKERNFTEFKELK